MSTDQTILFSLLLFVFVFLIWGRWRYDLVAFVALLLALLTGIVPKDQAFSGFGHPATVIIALVLIVSRGLSNSGAIELLIQLGVVVVLSDICPRPLQRPHRSTCDSISSFLRPILNQ